MEAETTAFEGPLPPNYQPWNTGSSLPSSVQTNQQQMATTFNAEGSGLYGHVSRHQMHWQSPAAEAAAQAAESAVAQYSEMHAKDGKEGGLRSSSAAPLGATMPAAALLTTSTSLGPVTAHLKLAQSSLAKGPSHH